MTEAPALSDLERDAVSELANIGVSRAAASLRKMVGRQVLLSVPSVDILTRKAAAALVSERENDDLVAVQQAFTGPFSGRALLIFPQSNSLELIRAVIGDKDISAHDAAEMEEEALAETGNVILNGCLGTIANMLRQSLHLSLPKVMRGSGVELFEPAVEQGEDGLALFLYINFSVRDRDIRGYIAMLMDLPSLASMRLLVAEFISRYVPAETSTDVDAAALFKSFDSLPDLCLRQWSGLEFPWRSRIRDCPTIVSFFSMPLSPASLATSLMTWSVRAGALSMVRAVTAWPLPRSSRRWSMLGKSSWRRSVIARTALYFRTGFSFPRSLAPMAKQLSSFRRMKTQRRFTARKSSSKPGASNARRYRNGCVRQCRSPAERQLGNGISATAAYWAMHALPVSMDSIPRTRRKVSAPPSFSPSFIPTIKRACG